MHQQHNPTLPTWQRLRIWQVSSITGMGKSTIWEKSKDGTFPKPTRVSSRITVWNAEEIKSWLEHQSKSGSQNA